jgi:hypothetical protein
MGETRKLRKVKRLAGDFMIRLRNGARFKAIRAQKDDKIPSVAERSRTDVPRVVNRLRFAAQAPANAQSYRLLRCSIDILALKHM